MTKTKHFKQCTLYFMEQRSEEWHEIRRGILTATSFGPWLIEKPQVRITIEEIKSVLKDSNIDIPAKAKKDVLVSLLPNPETYATLTEAGKTAREAMICKLIAQRAKAWEVPTFETEAMRRGTELEPDAVAAYEAAEGVKIAPVGFCKSLHGAFGCSPDGLLMDSGVGFEGKVPIPATHIKYRRAGVLPPEYEFQVHGSMAVTGADAWIFQSWNPGLAPLRLTVKRGALADDIAESAVEFTAQLRDAIKEEAEAWEEAGK